MSTSVTTTVESDNTLRQRESAPGPQSTAASSGNVLGTALDDEQERHHIPRQGTDEPEVWESVEVPKDLSALEKDKTDVAIIGSGFSGLASAITMQNHFKDNTYTIFELHSDIGGTWHANTYPGCASDVPAPWYSLSTDLNPNWSELNPPQAELEEYLHKVVERHNIRPNTRLNSRVLRLDWDEENSVWNLLVYNSKTGREYIHEAKVVFMGQGILVHPNKYDVPGLRDKFKGSFFHSAHWDHSVDIKGKDVIIIGNGCSATQVVPNICNEAKTVTQLMRSGQWLVPHPGEGIYSAYKKFFSKSNFLMKIFRFLLFFGHEVRAPLFNSRNPFSGLVERYFTGRARKQMESKVPEEYQKFLIPDFKLGCKRMVIDKGYTDCLHRDNVHLDKDTIVSVSENHVHTKSGKTYHADVIVACTGYNVNYGLDATPIYGRRGAHLQSKWRAEGVSAYDTVMVDNSPNLFFLAGPNATTGHSSVVFAIEMALNYIRKVVKPVLEGKQKTVEVKSSAYQKWREDLDEAMKTTVFSSPYGGCVSWYAKGINNFTTYPWTQIYFWYRMTFPHWKDILYKKAAN